jgi:hypothetical protein
MDIRRCTTWSLRRRFSTLLFAEKDAPERNVPSLTVSRHDANGRWYSTSGSGSRVDDEFMARSARNVFVGFNSSVFSGNNQSIPGELQPKSA